MGSIRFVAPESAGWLNGATLALGVINVPGHSVASPASLGTTSWYAGMTLPTPIAAWKLGAAFDYLDIHDSHAADPANSIPANPSDDTAWDIALYSSYQATDTLALNLRAEYLRDQLGGGADFLSPVPYSHIGRGGNAAEEATATVQYQLWANVISRVEFRWDHVEHGSAFGFDPADVVSSGAYKANDFLLALNLIYQF
jgi:Putative beta-barrel porin-2, OmpL-like. bbp2